MDIFYDFNSKNNVNNLININENYKYNNKYFALMDTMDSVDPSADKVIKAPERLVKSKKLLEEVQQNVSLCLKELEEMKNIVNKYKMMSDQEKTAAQKDIKIKIENINKIFDSEFFSSFKYSYFEMDFYSSVSKFIVQAGENMDQTEWFYLGPGGDPHKYSIYGLSLDGIDLINKTDESINIINEAYRIIYYELGKVKSYKNRLNHIIEFNLVYEKPYGDYYEYKKNTVSESPIELTKNMLLISDSYLSNTLIAVQKLREIAEKASIKEVGSEDRLILQVEVSAMIDEISRIGSHAHFNGMTILTGRFGIENTSNWTWDPSMYINLDKSVDNYEKIIIEGFTPYELNFINKSSWEPASVNTPEDAEKFLDDIIKAEIKIKKQKDNLKNIYNKLPGNAVYKNNPLEDYIKDYDFYDFLNKSKLVFNNLDPNENNFNNNLAMINLYINKLDEIETYLIKIRKLSVKACSGIYTSGEKSDFDTTVQIMVNEIDSILKYTKFNNSNIFNYGISGKNKIILDYIIQTEYSLEPLNIEKLGLKGGYRTISISDWNNANMSIGIIDSALSWIYMYRNTLHCYYETIKIYEKLNMFCDNLDKVYYLDKKDREEAVKLWTKNILLLSDEILKEMKYYTWKSTNSIYTYSDRNNLQKHFNFLAENLILIKDELNILLSDGLIVNSMIDKNYSKKISAGFNDVIKDLKNNKNKYMKIDSRSNAVNSYYQIDKKLNNLMKITDSINTKNYNEIYKKYEKKSNEINLQSFEFKKNNKEYQKLKGIYFALEEIEKSAAVNGDRKDYISKLVKEAKINNKYVLKGEEVSLILPDKNKMNIKLKSTENLRNKEDIFSTVIYNKELVNSYMIIYKANYLFNSLMKKMGKTDKIKLISTYISVLNYSKNIFLKSNSLLYNDSQKDLYNTIGSNVLHHYNYFIAKDKNTNIIIDLDKIEGKEIEDINILIKTLINEIMRLD